MHRTSSVLARITSYLYACIVYKIHDTRGTPYDLYLMNPNLNPNAIHILLTKTTAARNGAALSYHSVRGLCFLAVVFAATIAVQMI